METAPIQALLVCFWVDFHCRCMVWCLTNAVGLGPSMAGLASFLYLWVSNWQSPWTFYCILLQFCEFSTPKEVSLNNNVRIEPPGMTLLRELQHFKRRIESQNKISSENKEIEFSDRLNVHQTNQQQQGNIISWLTRQCMNSLSRNGMFT